MFSRKTQAVPVAEPYRPGFPLLPALPNRSHRMYNISGFKTESMGNCRPAHRNPADFPASGEQVLLSCCLVRPSVRLPGKYRPGVGDIDDCVGFYFCNIVSDDLKWHLFSAPVRNSRNTPVGIMWAAPSRLINQIIIENGLNGNSLARIITQSSLNGSSLARTPTKLANDVRTGITVCSFCRVHIPG